MIKKILELTIKLLNYLIKVINLIISKINKILTKNKIKNEYEQKIYDIYQNEHENSIFEVIEIMRKDKAITYNTLQGALYFFYLYKLNENEEFKIKIKEGDNE